MSGVVGMSTPGVVITGLVLNNMSLAAAKLVAFPRRTTEETQDNDAASTTEAVNIRMRIVAE